MNSYFRSFLPLICCCFGFFITSVVNANQLFATEQHPIAADKAFALDTQITANKMVLVWTIAEDYYLYQDKLRLVIDGRDITSALVLPTAKPKLDPLFGDSQVYYNQLSLQIALPNVANKVLNLTYQGCWEGGVCYPPQQTQINLPEATVVDQTLSNYGATSINTSNQGVYGTDANWFTQQLAQANLMASVVVFFLAGLGLALTPCVLPMVPILSNLIVGITPKPSASKSFLLSLTYVLAMAITYSLVGVLAGLSGANLQIALQHPIVITIMVLLFLVFAAAMFDWITIQMPVGLQNRLNQLSQQQASGHYFGVGIIGVISALVVGPCVAAPLAGALLYIGQTGDPYTGGLGLFALGMGMGMPLLLVGTSAGQFFPKAGAWMNRVKYVFGFLMLYLAIWMLDRILPIATVPLVATLTLIASLLLWQVARWQPPIQHILGRVFIYGLGLLMTGYSVALFGSIMLGQASLLQPLKPLSTQTIQVSPSTNMVKVKAAEIPNLLALAVADEKPVLLDFYADWCVSCKELDSFVFTDNSVRQALQDFAVIKVDVTDNSELDQALMQKYNIVGPPGLVFFDKQGAWLSSNTIVGVPNTSDFAQLLTTIAAQ
jgi:thiol:disulfide interchange protein DsbD